MGHVKKQPLLAIDIINHRKICEKTYLQYEDFVNYKEMSSYLGYFNLIKKLDVVMAPSSELPLYIGNCEFMNIDYFFNYLLRRTSMSANLSESIFAGGWQKEYASLLWNNEPKNFPSSECRCT